MMVTTIPGVSTFVIMPFAAGLPASLIHVTLVDNVLQQNFIKIPPLWGQYLLILLLISAVMLPAPWGQRRFIALSVPLFLQSASIGKTVESISGVYNLSAGPVAARPMIRGLTGERICVLSDGIGPNIPFGICSTPAYFLVNISTGFDLTGYDHPIGFELEIANVLNKAYRDFLHTYKGYTLVPGRSVNLRFHLPFGKL